METLPLLPDNLPHKFTEIAWDIIPEINYDDIVYLSSLIKASNRESIFEPLKDALRKGLRAKLAGQEACMIDKVCIQDYVPSTILQDPVGQIKHAKSIIEFVYHLKSSLDSIAIFLNEYLNAGLMGGDRDFRKAKFRKRISELDVDIKSFLNLESEWFDISNKSTNSILATRDEWIHRNSPNVALVQPPGILGIFPIPILFINDLQNISPTTYRSTEEFFHHHWKIFVRLFTLLLQRSIDIESKLLTTILPRQKLSQYKISIVKTSILEQILVEKIKIGSFTRNALS